PAVMTRTSFEGFNCSMARSLDILGDKWTMLIIRDAFYGVSSFSQFRDRLRVSPHLVRGRLELLVRPHHLPPKPVPPEVARHASPLSDRGKALFPIRVLLPQWGDKWLSGVAGEPVQILDRQSRAPVQPVAVLARDGRYLRPRDIVFAPGPSASAKTLRAFQAVSRDAARGPRR